MHLDQLVELVNAIDALLVAVAERVSALLLRLLEHTADRIEAYAVTSEPDIYTCTWRGYTYPYRGPRAAGRTRAARSGGRASGRGSGGARD